MRRPERLFAALLVACTLGGCAGTHWERAIYDGMRAGSAHAERLPQPRSVPPSTPLPAYDDYERERERLQRPER